jgi:hypothetical protein
MWGVAFTACVVFSFFFFLSYSCIAGIKANSAFDVPCNKDMKIPGVLKEWYLVVSLQGTSAY